MLKKTDTQSQGQKNRVLRLKNIDKLGKGSILKFENEQGTAVVEVLNDCRKD